jgi:hypothetical protein
MTLLGLQVPRVMVGDLMNTPRVWGCWLERWRHLRAAIFEPYRPELHYMRGPGPKWRAKHAIKRAR